MSDSQRKIIGFIMLAIVCAFVEVASLTAEPIFADVTCAEGQECPEPPMSAETAFGNFMLPTFVTGDNFETMKWTLFGIALAIEAASALMIVKTLRENQSSNNSAKIS